MTIRPRAPRPRSLLLLVAVAAVAACAAPSGASPSAPPPGATLVPAGAPTGAPSPAATAATGIDALVADLVAAGAVAKPSQPFTSEPIGGEGRVVCVGPEYLRTYQFIDHEAALAASQKIDPEQLAQINGAMVDWAGAPRFWLRDRIIVLYLGSDENTDAALRTLLGEPFAEADSGRMPLPEPPCE